MKIETIAAQAAHRPDPATGAVAPPLYLSTTYERDADGGFSRGLAYSRSNNPNRADLETCLAQLEGGTDAACFASGMAAIGAVLQALQTGDHVIAPSDCYHGTRDLLREVFAPWGLATTFIDMSDAEQVRRAIRPNTRLLLVETPSNPLLRLTDLAQMVQLARQAGAWCVCDNTLASPMLQRPLELGVDLVIHSTTKYLSGHEDAMAGAVISREDSAIFQRVRMIQGTAGAVPPPFECWLTLRGIRTLHLRMRAISDNAMQVARFLSDHPRVEAVHYPGLPDHPGHELARQQMSAFGGLLSFQVIGDRQTAIEAVGRLKVFVRATSLGGTQSLIEHRASIEGPQTTTPDNLLRVSVGIENVTDLIEDLAQALG